MPYSVRREDFLTIQAAWAELVEQQPEPVPFLHPVWYRVWLEEFQNDADVLLLSVRDGEQLLGVAPLLRQDGQLSLVGHFSICDYMDFVVAPGRSHDFFPALMEALLAEEWSELELWGLREGSPALAAMPALAAGAGLRVERETEAVAPRIELAPSWEEYLATLSKKDRHELRRKLRRLQAAGELSLRLYTAPEDMERHVPLLLRMMVESRSDKAAFMSEQMGRFFHRMVPALAEQGLVRLYELELDAKPVASVLCFDQGGQFFLYNSGYDPQYSQLAVGLLSKALCLRDAIEAGRHCVDLLRGQEPYKYDLGAKDQTIYRCVVRRS